MWKDSINIHDKNNTEQWICCKESHKSHEKYREECEIFLHLK